MEAIYIPQLLRAPEQTEKLQIRDYLPGLDTLTPVQGQVRVTHRGNYLEVVAQAETIITLTCDRCLQQYNQRVLVDTSELIWLQKSVEEIDIEGGEREVALHDLVETLDPDGHFLADEWLYEQFCLALPQRQLCDAQCQGIPFNSRGSEATPAAAEVDRRWASLEALKGQFWN